MAYSINNCALRLNMLGTVGDATTRADSVKYLWGYVSADTAAVGETAGYFPLQSAGGPAFTIGDTLRAVWNCGVGNTPVTKDYVVTAITGNVTIAISNPAAG